MNTLVLLFMLLFSVIPLIIFIFVLVWIHSIKANTEKQVEQNEKMIELMREIIRNNQ